MSGTSLDGIDLAYAEFTFQKKWSFRILAASTYRYSPVWTARLSGAHALSGEKLLQLHTAYGAYVGKCCLSFIRRKGIRKVDVLASHGHTVFHQPAKGFTFALGDGNSLHMGTSIPVVCDFRSLDVALGGQGAPLVPVGDKLLFPRFDVCLNLGGIANISMDVRGSRKAFDVCFCNMALNFLINEAGKSFDRNGRIAATGSTNKGLLRSLLALSGAIRKDRKALTREIFEKKLVPLLSNRTISLADRLRTVCEVIAAEITLAVPAKKRLKLLVTGGGAHNSYLVDLLRAKLEPRVEVIVPPKELVDFKEALIFGFLAVLRLRNEPNVLRSVTKAGRDSCSGVLIGSPAVD